MGEVLDNFIIKVISEYGLFFGLLSLLVLVILLSIAKNYASLLWVLFWRFVVKRGHVILRNPRDRNLSEHIVFKKFQNLINVRLHMINTSCPIREKLFARIMTLRSQAFIDSFNEFIKTKWFKKLDSDEFLLRINELFQEIFDKWWDDCIREGVPEWLMLTFSNKIDEHSKRWPKQLNVLCNSTYLYQDNIDRMYSIMSMTYENEEYYLSLLESILDETNGELKKITFQGVHCLQCKLCAHEIAIQKKELDRSRVIKSE